MHRQRRARSLVIAAAVLLMAACTSTPPTADEGSDETQAEARAQLEDVVRDLLTSAAPEVEDGLSDTTEVPCGGLGGNERNKVKYTLESIDGIQVQDRAAALEAAQTRIEERGWDARAAVDGVGFSAGGVKGTIWVRPSGVLVSAETDCMANAER